MRCVALILLCCVASGCGPFADLPVPGDAAGTRDSYPDFAPIEQVALDQAEAEERAVETGEEVEARVNGLKARAARLKAAELN